MKKFWIFFSTMLLIILSGSTAYYYYNQPVESVLHQKAQYSVAAPQLLLEFTGNETTANEKYLERVVQVSGLVKEVTVTDSGEIAVTLDAHDELGSVICQMETLSGVEADEIRSGSVITLKGICTGVLMDVVMVQCVIV